MNDLPRYTWDQATILGLATANGFRALGINAATIRKWASRPKTPIRAVGKAPGGAHLYAIAVVTRHAERRSSANVAGVSHLGASGRPMPDGGSSFVSPKLSDPTASVEP
jgi:hypothetical protein